MPNESQHIGHDELQQVLGNPPSWLQRWGITALLLATLICLVLAWMIRYPDVINAPVKLTTDYPPVEVVARSSGKLSQLMVADKDSVQAGQLLGVLENTSNEKDILKLADQLTAIEQTSTIASLSAITLPSQLKLGALQTDYAALVRAKSDLKFYFQQDHAMKKVAALQKQIDHIIRLNTSLKQQETSLNQSLELTRKNHLRNKNLLEKGAVSEVDVEQALTRQLEAQRTLENQQATIINNDLKIEEIRVQMLELEQAKGDQLNSRSLEVRRLTQQLKSGIETWKQTYLLVAPYAGRLAFAKSWRAQQFVQQDEVVLTVLPLGERETIIGEGVLPLARSGKVVTGMRVNVRLDGYPYREYGVLQGTVQSMALLPQNDAYQLKIKLPTILTTTYQKNIPFQQDMQGIARIITEDRRLIERLIDPIKSLMKNQ